jgi:septum formation protein
MLLHEQLQNFDLVLASQSPRRKILLEGLNLKFRVFVRENIDETVPSGLDKMEIPVYLAEHKSKAYADILNPDTLLLTADTIVWINGREIGKPKSTSEAVDILTELSGNMHEVITGVCIRSTSRKESFSALSEVYFRNLSKDEIEYYIQTFTPFDKAGSYGIQDWIGYAGIEKIKGSFYNVMGLPVQTLYNELLKFISHEKK